jgi:hypothetical protein
MTAIRRDFLRSLLSLGGVAAVVPALPAAPRSFSPSGEPDLDHRGQLYMPRAGRSRRASSWNLTGRNMDRIVVGAGETAEIANLKGAGCIQHIWMTVNAQEPEFLRRLVFRASWDGESSPSIECPLGDFFGVGHARATNY